MKQSLKRNYFFVLFSLVSLLLCSCAEEKEFIKEENKKVIKFEQKTLDEVLQISKFNKAYQKLVKKNAKIGNSALAKSALEEEHDFTIDPEVVKLTEAEDGTKSYNMLITRPTTSDAFFENLVIVNDTLNNLDAFIIKYIPNEQATYIPMHSSYAFDGEKEMEQIVSSGRFSTIQIGNGCFYTVLTLCYDISPNYSAEFQVPHSPTPLCSANFIFTSTSLITCEPNETNTVYVGNGPTNPTPPPTGSNMGASGSGNANTIDITIVPPCRFNCIEAVEDETDELIPCPGDPVKNPIICPSSPTNIEGGTFGCTRFANKVCDGVTGRKKHGGLDLLLPPNQKVFSMHPGYVVDIRTSFSTYQYVPYSLGNYVEVESIINGETVRIKYCHLSSSSLQIGQIIGQSNEIAISGKSGNAGAKGVTAHLHIQARKMIGNNWVEVNPQYYLDTIFSSTTLEPIGSVSNCN